MTSCSFHWNSVSVRYEAMGRDNRLDLDICTRTACATTGKQIVASARPLPAAARPIIISSRQNNHCRTESKRNSFLDDDGMLIKGLASTKQYNSKLGPVKSYAESKTQYVVLLDNAMLRRKVSAPGQRAKL